MVTQVITKTWCSVHYQDSDGAEQVDATFTGPVVVGNVRSALDLCDEHYAKLIGNLAEVLATYGQPSMTPGSAPQPANSGKMECEFCHRHYKAAGMGLHLNRAHGIVAGGSRRG
jgi:hypothetical protein